MAITDTSIGIAEYARAAEDLGFDSASVGHHSHTPVPRTTDGDTLKMERDIRHTIEDRILRIVDPVVALAVMAAVTERITIGTSLLLVTEYDPISLAKALATVDQVSGGRLVLGIGAGWNVEELRNHGVAHASRFRVMRERALAMLEIWQHEQAEFHGEFVEFDPLYCWPKPVQRPHPPVLIGGHGPSALDQVVEYADGWLPSLFTPRAELEASVQAVRERAAAAGRPRPIVTMLGPEVAPGAEPEPAVIERLAAAGVDRCLVVMPTAPASVVVDTMQRVAAFVERLG